MASINEKLEQFLEPIKDAFTIGSRRFVGIDIGLSGVKMAEVSINSKGVVKLLRYSYEPFSEGAIIEDEIIKEEEIRESILEAFGNLNIKNGIGAIGLAGPHVVTRKLQLAGGSDEEIDDQVSWELEQYIPFNIEDSATSYHVVGENVGGGIDVVIGAVRVDILDNFKNLFNKSGIKVKIVDTNMAAIINIFEYVIGERELLQSEGSYIILDFGAQRTEFIVYRGGSIVFCKEINMGGIVITEEIQRKMGVNYADAENIKIMGDQNGNLPEEVLTIIDDVMEVFFAEIKKTLDFYVQSTSDESFLKTYVTGGSSQIPGFLEGIEAMVETEVEILNPLNQIDYDRKHIKNDLLDYLTYTGVVAIGLAMRRL